ncbi:hypothetical protein A3D00_02410 [Candidatus Woesebacteria bacterium RIFCSPHIGHO2_02_FULL_38_9]|nr:MAG: hypothetical protein A3D00_02410 [Candidatus Woesebacteria bacterium RIFCSPHIGHO2_02_FULL_38_9]
MKNFRKIILIILAGILSFGVYKSFKKTESPDTVRAFGDLSVTYLTVPLGAPIFSLNNMAPGDPPETRDIVVTNSSPVDKFVAVRGIRTGGIGGSPQLENVLDIVISEGGTDLYGGIAGAKTVKDFFDASDIISHPNGIPLSTVGSGHDKTYKIKVTFPSSAGNPFQNKSVIFDLTFGIVTGNNVVINEVYYKVDRRHGLDGTRNDENCRERERGNNKNKEKDDDDDKNDRKDCDEKGKRNGINDEWIELYNPTDRDISLKNWTLIDNWGVATKINANKIIKKNGFALISKDASLWRFWNENRDAIKIELGRRIGNGLDNSGDRLILKNSLGAEVDFVAWGNDIFRWNPAVLNLSLGSSIERLAPGLNSDSPIDWHSQTPPSPGS